jgi:hypothetical protein
MEGHTKSRHIGAEVDAAPDQTIGEVVEAGTTRFLAQCPPKRLHAPPAFGTFVCVLPEGQSRSRLPTGLRDDDPFAESAPLRALPSGVPDGTLYALVFRAATGSLEPGRRAAAYGLDESSLRAEQPQIFDLLATEFAALHVGYADAGRFRPHTPPRPPRLHAFVYPCSPEEVCALTEAPDVLRTLLQASGEASPDELIAACLRHAYECRKADFAFLVRAGKQLANLLRDDPERLTALLRKLEPG